MKNISKPLITLPILISLSPYAFAEDNIQDMSDPLSVYTQAGLGYTDKGLNVKIGRSYDTGIENTAGMNVFELKGIGGESLGWNGSSRENNNDSPSLIRFRNFQANIKNGQAKQIDINYDLNNEMGTASYSFIQALPQIGPFNFFPLAGVGASFGNNVVGDDGETISGYSIPGTFIVAGTYAKLALTEKIWLNYNPMWKKTLSGSDTYKDHGFEDNNNVLAHEFAASYQINPRFNVRYFANWSENTNFSDGSHRIEFNYQF
ncbi:hypothetical protein MD588_01355 [Photobacterium sp. SDRW27]|uniref:hypothetical protein n=1 Tax=Photobacterium obscurum TaxID=2829490 RepID=UPI002243217B|nr:hypothetical protein [Photobacterium obscurum]MCW8327449.1 hypothetical protein [Photobacterium obscurum]